MRTVINIFMLVMIFSYGGFVCADEREHETHMYQHQENDDAHEDYHKHDHHHGDHDEEGPHHEHSAPHGGTLVALGEHFAHIEFVLDDPSGELIAYVLDGEAENAIRIEQENIQIKIGLHHDENHLAQESDLFTIKLSAKANLLTGESVGDTSEFTGQSSELVGADDFEAEIEYLNVKGQELAHIEFHFPEGNE